MFGVAGQNRRGGRVDLDEDALTRAHLRSVDHGTDVTVRHLSQTSRSAWVVAGTTALGDVCDSIFELHEDIVTVIDADAVARTEVLVDPHAHDSEGR